MISIDDHKFFEKYISSLSPDTIKELVQKIISCEPISTKHSVDRMFVHMLCQLSEIPRFSRRMIRVDPEVAICSKCYARSAWKYSMCHDDGRYPIPLPHNNRWYYCCRYAEHIPGHEIYAVEISDTPLKLSKKNRGQRSRGNDTARHGVKYPQLYKDINHLGRFRLTLPRLLRYELLIDIDIICSN